MKAMRRVLALLPLAVLSGCIELTQEVWIHPDGSGRLRMDVGISEVMASMEVHSQKLYDFDKLRAEGRRTEATLKSDPLVRRFTFAERTASGTQFFTYDLEVTDATQLDALAKKIRVGAEEPVPTTEGFKVEKRPDGSYAFTMKMEPPPGMPSRTEEDKAAQNMMAAMLGDKAIVVRVHGPRILASNGAIDTAKTTAEWKIPLVDLATGRFKLGALTAEVAASPGGFMAFLRSLTPLQVGLGAAGLVAILGLLAFALRRR